MTRHRERGAAMVEGALTLLTVLTLFLGTIEFGRLMWIRSTLLHAAQEGARYASVRSNSTKYPATLADIQEVARSQCVGLDRPAVNVSVTWTPKNATDSDVKVVTSYAFLPIVSLFLGQGFLMTQTSERRITN